MKKLLCLVMVLTGGIAYSSILAGAYSHVLAALSSVEPFRAFTYFALCAMCVFVMVLLRKQGRIPLGFFSIVLGGFFLGAASRSPSPSAETYAALGFALFVAGYLLVRFETRRVTIEFQERPDPELKGEMIKRLLDAYQPATTTSRLSHELPVQ